MNVTQWMSWEGGVDLVASTTAGSQQPNVIVHLARLVHTPVGSAPSGMVFYQPDSDAAPQFMGFVSTNPTVGAYFGPHIFAGTPFEHAPVLAAEIEIATELPNTVRARVALAGFVVETELTALSQLVLVHRPFGEPLPFVQQGLEAEALRSRVHVNGVEIPLHPLAVGLSGGPSAVWAPAGVYAR